MRAALSLTCMSCLLKSCYELVVALGGLVLLLTAVVILLLYLLAPVEGAVRQSCPYDGRGLEAHISETVHVGSQPHAHWIVLG